MLPKPDINSKVMTLDKLEPFFIMFNFQIINIVGQKMLFGCRGNECFSSYCSRNML